MRVQCVICDKIEDLPADSLEAKRLRNRPIHTHMCKPCHDRISERTKERIDSGQFRFFRSSRSIEDDF